MKNEEKFRTVRGYHLQNAESKMLTSSMEDYLEMICRTCIGEGYTRTSRLAKALNVRPPSVTKVIQKLRNLGLVDYQRYGIIRPTDKGKVIGDFLLKRHDIIEKFLRNLGVEKTRLKDTEMIEHDVSIDTLLNIHVLNKFFLEHPDILEEYTAFKEEYTKGNGDNEL